MGPSEGGPTKGPLRLFSNPIVAAVWRAYSRNATVASDPARTVASPESGTRNLGLLTFS